MIGYELLALGSYVLQRAACAEGACPGSAAGSVQHGLWWRKVLGKWGSVGSRRVGKELNESLRLGTK